MRLNLSVKSQRFYVLEEVSESDFCELSQRWGEREFDSGCLLALGHCDLEKFQSALSFAVRLEKDCHSRRLWIIANQELLEELTRNSFVLKSCWVDD